MTLPIISLQDWMDFGIVPIELLYVQSLKIYNVVNQECSWANSWSMGQCPTYIEWSFCFLRSGLYNTLGIDNLIAVGPTSERGHYQLTFNTVQSAQAFVDAGDFIIEGSRCVVYMLKQRKFSAKIHFLPFAIEDDYIWNLMKKKYGLTLICRLNKGKL